MKMKFRAEKMLNRCRADEELKGMLDEATVKFIESLDGKVGEDYCWRSVVEGENVVWIEADSDLENGIYVNRDDCEVYLEAEGC